MRRILLSCIIGFLWLGARPGATQTGPPTDQVEKKPPPRPVEKKKLADESLDDLIQRALKLNPDLRITEAKLRLAEANLYGARVKVVSDVTVAVTDIKMAEANVTESKTRWNTNIALFNRGACSQEDVRLSELAYEKCKAELATAQAKLPYLLGQQPHPAAAALEDYYRALSIRDAVDGTKVEAVPGDKATQSALQWLGVMKFDKSKSLTDSTMAEKVRKALDVSKRHNATLKSQQEVMDYLRESLPGINLRGVLRNGPMHVQLDFGEPLPLGAVLQYFEDELRMVFVLRDYGIVFTSRDETLPPGAIFVTDFWKQRSETAKAKK